MITIIKRNSQNGAVTLRGLSTDTKPTSTFSEVTIANGSEYVCIDNGDRYLFDAETSTWNKIPSAVGTIGVTSFNSKTGSVLANITASGDGTITLGLTQTGDDE